MRPIDKGTTPELNFKSYQDAEPYLDSIIILAKSSGFFSVWMTVFSDIEVVRTKLLDNFTGTKKEYF